MIYKKICCIISNKKGGRNMVSDYEKIYGNIYDNNERKELTARKITELRKENGLTQKEVSEKIGVTQQSYNSYEKGRTAPTIEILVRLSYLYEVPIDIIVDKGKLNKDEEEQRKILEGYGKEIEVLKKQVETANPENKERIKKFIEGMEQMLKAIE